MAPPMVPPNGLELSCPVEAGCSFLVYGTPAGKTSNTEDQARRVSFSELLGGGSRHCSEFVHADYGLTLQILGSGHRIHGVKII